MSDTPPSESAPHQPDEPTDAPVVDAVLEPAPAPESGPVGTPAVAPVTPEETGYSTGGVPTFDYVREKIETRLGTSIGTAELAAETPEGRSIDEQYEARQKAAADRLAQIRESMKNEDS